MKKHNKVSKLRAPQRELRYEYETDREESLEEVLARNGFEIKKVKGLQELR